MRCGRAGTGVVEEELLGVAAVGAEVLAGEGGQFFGWDVCFLFKVEFFEGSFDPDVDGKESEAFSGEEKDAGGDFGADAWGALQVGERVVIADGWIVQEREVERAGSDHVGGIGEVAGAISEAAFLKEAGTGGGEGGWFRVSVQGGAVPRNGLAKLLAQGVGDLTNMGDLFERGRDESGEAFPSGLPD